MDNNSLSPLATSLIDVFDKKEFSGHHTKITINPFVSEIASWYEKLRNAMDIRDDEVVFRSAIERILKRRIVIGEFLGSKGEKNAEFLIRELLWARYFQESSLPENAVSKVTEKIVVYLELKQKLIQLYKKQLSEKTITTWFYQLLSCDLANFLRPNKEKDTMSNFIYHILKDRVQIEDDTNDTKNVQVFIAVRRAFARDDIAFLRFYLFQQIFDGLNKENVDAIATSFLKGYTEIEKQLSYKLKEKIYVYVKKQTPIFFIFEDVLRAYKGNVHALISNQEEFKKAIFAICEARYKGIKGKVRRAVIRSVIFLIITKALLALSIEGAYDNYVYGKIIYRSIILNILIPPALMIIASLFIRTPKKKNSERILEAINTVLYDPNPKISYPLYLMLHPKKSKPFLNTIFTLLWLLAFYVSFGAIINILQRLQFNIVSQAIFVFFFTIVSFLSYRINITAHMYSVGEGEGLLTPFIDFLLLPLVRVGMRLTDGIAQINIIVFFFDFIIEAPFKGLFGFVEQLFIFLHTKREDLE